MSTATVSETIKRGGGLAATGIAIGVIELYPPNVTAYAGDTLAVVAGRITGLTTDSTGTWTQALERTDTMLPAGMLWRRTYALDNVVYSDLFAVPGAGPYTSLETLVQPATVNPAQLPYHPLLVVRAVSASGAVLATDDLLNATTGNAGITLTLPTAVGLAGRQYRVKKADAGLGALTLATTSAQTIDGATTVVLSTQYASVTVVGDGANWQIV